MAIDRHAERVECVLVGAGEKVIGRADLAEVAEVPQRSGSTASSEAAGEVSVSETPIARVDSTTVYPRLLSSWRVGPSLSWTQTA
jgi:hypothetical protein